MQRNASNNGFRGLSSLNGEQRVLKILITGGAGFLGSHLCERMLSEGHEVHCIDNYHTGRAKNVEALRASNRFSLHVHDITNEIPSDFPDFDEIYNFACPASPKHYQEDPVRTAIINSVGVWNVLKKLESDRARIFHASTSEVYGDPDIHPQPETYNGNVNPVGPRSCYDEGKRFAETLITDFARTRGLTVRMARIFNTYGPRMQVDDGRVVSNFIIQALRGEDLTIYGDGSQTRSFCYVDDLVRGVLCLMRSTSTIDGPVNLGNPAEIQVGALARQIVDMVGSRSKFTHLPLPFDDPRRRRPDITKANQRLGWRPQVELADGLRRTISYFDAILSSPKPIPLELSAAAF